MSTNLPGSKMQTCLCRPMCARRRARTTYFPCSAFRTDLNVCSSDKKRDIHLNKCKYFDDVLPIEKQRETTSLLADWLWSPVHHKSVRRFGPSLGVSLYQKKTKRKKMCSYTLSSQQELWVIWAAHIDPVTQCLNVIMPLLLSHVQKYLESEARISSLHNSSFI